MKFIQIILGFIIIAIGVNLGIIVSNLSKKKSRDREDIEFDDSKEIYPEKISTSAKILSVAGYIISALLILAGISYIIIRFILDKRFANSFGLF